MTDKPSRYFYNDYRRGVLTITFTTASLTSYEAPAIQEEITSLLDQWRGRARCVVLDMSQVSFIASVGLGMCIDVRHLIVEGGAKVVLFGLREELVEMFQLLKVDKLFENAGDHEELARAVTT